MKRRLIVAALLVALSTALLAANQAGSAAPTPRAPKAFFGIAPQTALTPEDLEYMKAGGIEAIRLSLPWAGVQPKPGGEFEWTGFDAALEAATRAGLEVLPSLGSPPRWIASKGTTMPINTARQRQAWTKFLRAAVERYGPGGVFWQERAQQTVAPDGVTYLPALAPPRPIRTWQIWNESNFFYFAFPVSPARYAQLVTISSQAIKSVSPGAKVLLSGLFGEPTATGIKGMPAWTFLERLYDVPGFRSRFDGVSLHPYAVDAEELEEMVERFHEVSVDNHDRPGFYITEMGWGSQNNFRQVAFEQGPQGQLRQMKDSYEYLLANTRRLNLKQTYWFSWRDAKGMCTFCDSVGFFREGKKFKPKPAWRGFVRLTGGSVRP